MRTFYVNVTWQEHDLRGNLRSRSKSFKRVKAKDGEQAREWALAKIGDRITPSVSMFWEVFDEVHRNS